MYKFSALERFTIIIIIISKSYIIVYSARIYQTRYSRRWVFTNSQKNRLLQWWILRPNYLAPYKGLQGATAHTAATARNTGANPFSFRKVHWVLLHALHNTWDQRLNVPSEGRSNGVLVKDTSVTTVRQYCYFYLLVPNVKGSGH